MIRLIAKIMLKILPKETIPPDYSRLPGENEYEYSKRVPLIKQPTAESPTVDYLGRPIKR